jgi:heme-degrading monooxygenase HmoA
MELIGENAHEVLVHEIALLESFETLAFHVRRPTCRHICSPRSTGPCIINAGFDNREDPAYCGTSMILDTGANDLARLWRGATKAEDAAAYLAYLHETGIAEYRRTPGNRGVIVLRRIGSERAEFLLLTLWESEDAVRRFAGEDMERAVFYPDDDRFLIARDERVRHFDVVFAAPAL